MTTKLEVQKITLTITFDSLREASAFASLFNNCDVAIEMRKEGINPEEIYRPLRDAGADINGRLVSYAYVPKKLLA